MANKRKQILTPEADKQLVVAFTTCKDGEMRTRIQAVRLYGNEVPVNEITNLTGLPRRTILRWYGRYRQQGLGGFVDNRQGGNHQYLTDEQIQDLAAKLHQYRPVDLFGQKEAATADGLHWCISDLRRAINHWYGIDYKRNASYRQLFQKCGFSWQRTAKVFRSRSEMKVAEFEEQLEKKVIDYAQTHPDAIYLSEDEASMYLQATTTSVWAPVGQTPVVKASPERDKVSFYGTLNLVSGQEIVTQAETMNSEATAIHLKQILAAYPAKQILLFWDRATWHGGAAVRQVLAENPRLELMKYPAGSPDLNPQEHVWKAARTHVSHNHDQPKLAELADRFERFLKTNKFNYSFLEKFSIETIRAMSK